MKFYCNHATQLNSLSQSSRALHNLPHLSCWNRVMSSAKFAASLFIFHFLVNNSTLSANMTPSKELKYTALLIQNLNIHTYWLLSFCQTLNLRNLPSPFTSFVFPRLFHRKAGKILTENNIYPSGEFPHLLSSLFWNGFNIFFLIFFHPL